MKTVAKLRLLIAVSDNVNKFGKYFSSNSGILPQRCSVSTPVLIIRGEVFKGIYFTYPSSLISPSGLVSD